MATRKAEPGPHVICSLCRAKIRAGVVRIHATYITATGRLRRRTWCADCDTNKPAEVAQVLAECDRLDHAPKPAPRMSFNEIQRRAGIGQRRGFTI